MHNWSQFDYVWYRNWTFSFQPKVRYNTSTRSSTIGVLFYDCTFGSGSLENLIKIAKTISEEVFIEFLDCFFSYTPTLYYKGSEIDLKITDPGCWIICEFSGESKYFE